MRKQRVEIYSSSKKFLTIRNLRHGLNKQRQPPEVLYKKAVLKNFAKFIGKHLCWSLFLLKVQAQAYNFIKKILQHRCFPVNIVKFLRTFLRKFLIIAELKNTLQSDSKVVINGFKNNRMIVVNPEKFTAIIYQTNRCMTIQMRLLNLIIKQPRLCLLSDSQVFNQMISSILVSMLAFFVICCKPIKCINKA